jgi:protein-S-isoprenylcysteine O-methyltransferase Ste14
MKTKIPPPLVMIFFGVCIFLSKRFLPTIDIGVLTYVGFAFYLIAAFLIINAGSAFRKHQTTVNPFKPESASSLVSSGVFSYSRNPMYLGMLFVLIGISINKSIFGGVIFTPLFVLYITVFQIFPEEEAMTKLFGEEFEQYRSKVRRWI